MTASNTTTATATATKVALGKGFAIGRSGQVALRDCAGFDKGAFAVDVMRIGKRYNASHAKGVTPRGFKTLAEATAFADIVNAGNGENIGSWYKDASNAVVVPVLHTADFASYEAMVDYYPIAVDALRSGKPLPVIPAKARSAANKAGTVYGHTR